MVCLPKPGEYIFPRFLPVFFFKKACKIAFIHPHATASFIYYIPREKTIKRKSACRGFQA